MAAEQTIRLLVVARWPVGGIRTYMRYVYQFLPRDRMEITVLAHATGEDEALLEDARHNEVRVVIVRPGGRGSFLRAILRELTAGRYDLIQSHGFISGVNVYLANLLTRRPHILTVHGILEEKYLQGWKGRIGGLLLRQVLCRVDVLYCVGRDIMAHLHEAVPALAGGRSRLVAISNGIDVERFGPRPAAQDAVLRRELGVGAGVFLIGFVGRFMPQKGFNFLIDAMEILEREQHRFPPYRVVAVGSGDYLGWYRSQVRERGLVHRFSFLPFRQDLAATYRQLNVVAMPSIWEACPLQPMEAMCTGTPIIPSDCIGLREVVAGTPARTFPSGQATALAERLAQEMARPSREEFRRFVPSARQRFAVEQTAARFAELCRETVAGSRPEALEVRVP